MLAGPTLGASRGSHGIRASATNRVGDQRDNVGENPLVAGAEFPPTLCPISGSDLRPSVVSDVCRTSRLVVALTLAAATTSRTGRLVEVLTLAATPTTRSGRLVDAPTLA